MRVGQRAMRVWRFGEYWLSSNNFIDRRMLTAAQFRQNATPQSVMLAALNHGQLGLKRPENGTIMRNSAFYIRDGVFLSLLRRPKVSRQPEAWPLIANSIWKREKNPTAWNATNGQMLPDHRVGVFTQLEASHIVQTAALPPQETALV